MSMTEEERKKKAHARAAKRYRKRNLRDVRKREVMNTEQLKRVVFDYYSDGKLECACCGEKEYKFLTLDHKDNDGNEDRRQHPNQATGKKLYARLIKNKFPEKFQLLCFNCNMRKGIDGICPHEVKRQQQSNIKLVSTNEI